jgi:D-alanyl-lipoteichoic acid acyltransferase DltB (MBOAT superfamily)
MDYPVGICARLALAHTDARARYIYIPLGGTKHVAVTSVLIFSFVALWHDLSFKLLAWGWLVSLFILPELSARFLLPVSKVRNAASDISDGSCWVLLGPGPLISFSSF